MMRLYDMLLLDRPKSDLLLWPLVLPTFHSSFSQAL